MQEGKGATCVRVQLLDNCQVAVLLAVLLVQHDLRGKAHAARCAGCGPCFLP